MEKINEGENKRLGPVLVWVLTGGVLVEYGGGIAPEFPLFILM